MRRHTESSFLQQHSVSLKTVAGTIGIGAACIFLIPAVEYAVQAKSLFFGGTIAGLYGFFFFFCIKSIFTQKTPPYSPMFIEHFIEKPSVTRVKEAPRFIFPQASDTTGRILRGAVVSSRQQRSHSQH